MMMGGGDPLVVAVRGKGGRSAIQGRALWEVDTQGALMFLGRQAVLRGSEGICTLR